MIMLLTAAAIAAAPTPAQPAPAAPAQHGTMQHGDKAAMDCCKDDMKDCCCCNGDKAHGENSDGHAHNGG